MLSTSLSGSAHALAIPVNHASTHNSTTAIENLARVMPQSSLGTPSSQLKYVLLGLGTQNYTCTSGDELAAPSTTGATGT